MARTRHRRRSPSTGTIQAAVDAVIVTLAWTVALLMSNITATFTRSDGRSIVLAAIAVGTTLVVMRRRGLYRGRPSLPRTEQISKVLVAVVSGAGAAAVAAAFLDWHIGAWEIVVGTTLAFMGRTICRDVIRTIAAEVTGSLHPTTTVIVGTGHEARELAEVIRDHPESQFALAGVVGNLQVAERNGLADTWIGPTSRLIELMHQHMITTAIVTTTGFRGEQFRNITRELLVAGYDVHLTTGVNRMREARFDFRTLSHEPLIMMGHHEPRRWESATKRLIDLIGATIALAVAAPVMLLTAIAIWLEDRGSITYTSYRVGKRGEMFPMHKFRSMVTNADDLKDQMSELNERSGPLFKVSNDPRITKVGRFIRETSIDELPQLFNVLRGDMSLVGPRPALPEEGATFDDELRERFTVRPGITGLWQVEARSNAAFNAYRRLDLHYVENWTVGLDLRILLATFEQVVVAIVLMPLRLLINDGQGAADAVTSQTAPATDHGAQKVVIDLRTHSRARHAAAEEDINGEQPHLPTPPQEDQSTSAI